MLWNSLVLRSIPRDLSIVRFQSIGRPLRILFYGSDKFSLATLQVLNRELKSSAGIVKRLGVVTGIKRPPNPVHIFANKEEIELHQWPSGNLENAFDLGVVVSFSHLIPEGIINSFPMGMINLHSSLLPRWRGAAPIIYSLKAGDTTTGVTVMNVAPKHYDVGNIILQRSVDISPTVLLPALHDTLSKVGAELVLECLRNVDEALENSVPQPREGVTYAPKVEGNSLSYLDFRTMTAREIFNLYRALYGFRPVLAEFHGTVVKLSEMELQSSLQGEAEEGKGVEGSFTFDRANNRILVNCAAGGHCIGIRSLQVLGKKPMTAIQFINGFVKKRPASEWIFNKVVQS